jgi:hypothetical protein
MTHDEERPSAVDAEAGRQVAEALHGLGEVQPPPDLVEQVLSRISHLKRRESSVRFSRWQAATRARSARTVLVGVAAAAAVVLAVVWYVGFPASSHTEGAIGTAQRDQATQIRRSDVTVSDPVVRAFLQTDAFDRLAHDKQAVAALENPAIQQLLAAGAAQAIASAAAARALTDPAILQALAAPAVQQALSSPAFIQLLNSQGPGAALGSTQLQQAVGDRRLYQALNSQTFVAALAAPGLQQALAAPGFMRALATATVQRALAAPGVAAAVSGPALQSALAVPGLQNALSDPTSLAQLNQALVAASEAAGNVIGGNTAAGEQH